MTTYYVDDGGSNTAPYDTWAKAATTLQTALTAASAGDIILMETTHQETSSAADLALASVTNAPGVEVYKVDSSNSDAYDPDGATVNFQTTTGAYEIRIAGTISFYGVRFESNENWNTLPGSVLDDFTLFKDCKITIGPGNRGQIQGKSKYIDCTIDTADASDTSNRGFYIYNSTLNSGVELINCTFGSGWQYRNNIFDSGNSSAISLVGCDLSSMTRNPTILVRSSTFHGHKFIDCKLPANYTVATGARQHRTEFARCNSTDDYEVAEENGDLVSEATIVRTGGAAKSWECTTTAYCGFTNPFYTEWIYAEADAAESKNFDLHFAYSGTRLTEEEIFMELEFMDSATTPYGTRVTTQKKASLGDSVGNPNTAIGTWGGSETYEEYLRITQTVGVANSIVRARIGIEKTSQTDEIYVDPFLEIS